MTLTPRAIRCRDRACGRQAFTIPGVVGTHWCYRHLSDDTRAVLWAMAYEGTEAAA